MKPDFDICVLRSGDDVGAAARLLKAFFAEEGFSTPANVIEANLRTMLNLDVCRVLVARRGAETLAVATLSFDFGIEFGWSAEIGDLYVAREARGGGLARALVETCEGVARDKGATYLYVTVTPHGADQGLNAFYDRLGFRDERRSLLAMRIGEGR